MKAMNIILTEWQTKMLQPLFDRAEISFDKKNPVGILAQIWANKNKDEPGFMAVRVIDGDTCNAIQSATGVEIGKIGTELTSVLIPEE
jgi:hypothetical protein